MKKESLTKQERPYLGSKAFLAALKILKLFDMMFQQRALRRSNSRFCLKGTLNRMRSINIFFYTKSDRDKIAKTRKNR